jgi:type II restriction enzyme
MRCVDMLEREFRLDDIYRHIDMLKLKYPDNNNIEAKIRQQLQILRDNGYISFLGRGKYVRL